MPTAAMPSTTLPPDEEDAEPSPAPAGPPADPGRRALLRGTAFMVGSALFFSGMGVAVRIASAQLPTEVVVFFRNGVALAVLGPFLFLSAGPSGFKTRRFSSHLVRAGAGLGGMYAYFFALRKLPLTDAMLLSYTTPLFMPVIARLWLGEPFPRGVAAVLALGFLGVALVVKPGLGVFQPIAAVALLSGLLTAVAQVGIRNLTRTEPPTRIVFYFCFVSTGLSALPLLHAWRTPDLGLMGILGLVGLLATSGQFLLTRAYALAPAAQVGPFMYSIVLFAGVLDFLIWDRLPDRFSAAGAALICLAGVLILRRPGERVEA